MTKLDKIKNLMWFDLITKLKDILTDLFSTSENLEERVDVLENSSGGGSQDLESILNNGNTAITPLGSIRLLDGDTTEIGSFDGSTYGNYFSVNSGTIYMSTQDVVSETSSGVLCDRNGNVEISATGGIATYNGNEIATISPISGTFVAPTSITVVNGIITAIS
jgi:hypothetical protein